MSTYNGSCHCGETQWTVDLGPDDAKHILCHCNTCKSLSGGAYTLNVIIPRSALQFTKGGDALKTYTYKGDSGKSVHCLYCPTCTSHPYHHQEALGNDKIVLRTGLLEKAKELEPVAEVYGKDRFAWEKEVAETFSVMP
ncbi:hypothetical protein M501DRAFT_930167 [Patellaria atrata CBS 101060]|uniref:CENP-V/GFA domain-containing protein n=1 Tax=Patellaria atrata CBS 101060 TaxID=1346257 RepID=A0A9P4SDZ5_9PEZI|nr:hypothetical protein M501DRAFT_930167 [Patellaria atrata CBS 101060]